MKKHNVILIFALCAALILMFFTGCTSPKEEKYEYLQPNGDVCTVTVDMENGTATYSGTSITWMFLKGWSYRQTAEIGMKETVTGSLTLIHENFAGEGNNLYEFAVTDVPDHITNGWKINITHYPDRVELSLNGYGTYSFRKV